MNKSLAHYSVALLFFICAIISFGFQMNADSSGVYTTQDLVRTRTCGDARISPDGKWVAYTVSRYRDVNEKPGPFYKELYLVSTTTRQVKPFVTGNISLSSPRWSPDSSRLAFRTKRGTKAKTQVWVMALNGGEAVQATHSKSNVNAFQWHPKQNKIAYISQTPPPKKELELKKKGYGFTIYEENLRHKNLYIQDLDKENSNAVQLTKGVTIQGFEFSPDGNTIAATVTTRNLTDYSYMFKQLHVIDVKSGKMDRLTEGPRKLGTFYLSPDGSKLLYTAALDKSDNQISQVYVLDVKTKKQKNLTIPKFRGHVNWALWKGPKTILYHAGEATYPTLSLVPSTGGQRRVILNPQHLVANGNVTVTFSDATFSTDFKHMAFVGSGPGTPPDLFYWKTGDKNVSRLTDLNPWLKERTLGKQTVIRYKARDGVEIEGLLIHPVNYKEGQKYPMIAFIHGGPEHHYFNRWVTRYSEPAQVLAGRGYALFYPNYRASTGYGVDFARVGLNNPAGIEFDDIADGIDYLVKKGLADPERVGMGGGSYGGYAGAWFATYYTKLVRAVCMYAGISDLVAKRGTTDTPYEELYVHSGKKLEEMWKLSLDRSPIYWAHQSKTAVLIAHGGNDARVHPSQSLGLFNRFKMNNHPAYRLIIYPGEGHGNRNHTGRIDYLYRVLQWFDWYLKDKKPLEGPKPPLDISDKYGLEQE
ncbi:MAG: S9 family peptidase [bacterium]|nr:S9 family peptidase [bacterium]